MWHNNDYGGNSQSLGFITKEGKGKLVGVINPNENGYVFGPLKNNEKITVISGEMFINGNKYQPNEFVELKKGTEFLLKASTISIYLREETIKRK